MPQLRKKIWSSAEPVSAAILAQFRDFHPVLAQVLYNRGYTDAQAAQQFIAGELPDRDPFQMMGMADAVARLRQAIRAQEPIAVYGDFDTDGVTSTVLLVQTFRALGGVVEPYIPNRVEDGYGLNSSALTQLAQDGFKLIVTVDCGMRAVQEVMDGQRFGLDIIITDHHSIGPELPPALAIINPKQEDCPYPEDMLAGVGVAYYLATALLQAAEAAGEQVSLHQEDLLDLVAIGTVADLAPMDRLENRGLVIKGLEMINKAHRPGLYALIEESGLKPEQTKIKASHIGFALGPRINAAGRLQSASTAYE
ncbi:DHH family phosphoesterase, partial [Chloroflexota bacterium]